MINSARCPVHTLRSTKLANQKAHRVWETHNSHRLSNSDKKCCARKIGQQSGTSGWVGRGMMAVTGNGTPIGTTHEWQRDRGARKSCSPYCASSFNFWSLSFSSCFLSLSSRLVGVPDEKGGPRFLERVPPKWPPEGKRSER